MNFPPPSGLSSPDPLTRRDFVQRLIGGTGITSHALKTGLPFAAVIAAGSRRVIAASVSPDDDVSVDELVPTSTNNTDALTVGKTLGNLTDALLYFSDLQGFFSANSGASFQLVITLTANGLVTSLATIVPELLNVAFDEATATWTTFSNATVLDTAPGIAMTGRLDFETLSFDISSFAGKGGNTIRLRYSGGTDPDGEGVINFASKEGTPGTHPFVESVGGATPSPTLSPSPSPAATVSSTPAPTVSNTPAPTISNTPAPTVSNTPAPTLSGTPTPAPTASMTPSPAPTVSMTPTPPASASMTPTPSQFPTPTPTPSIGVTASSTPRPTPTLTPAPTTSMTPTPGLSAAPSPTPSPLPPALARLVISGVTITGNTALFNGLSTQLINIIKLLGTKFDSGGQQTFEFDTPINTGGDRRPFSASDEIPFTVNATGPDGTYFVRMRASTPFGYGPPSNEVSFLLGAGRCEAAPPAQPGALTAVVNGLDAALAWGEAQGATSYILEVGRTPGGTDVLRTNVGFVTSISGRQLPGTYYARVRGSNACGDGPPSNEVQIVLTTSESSPGQPLFLSAQVTGRNVLVTWSPPVGGGSVDGYRLQAGTQPNEANAGEQDLSGTSLFVPNVPPGRYYVRVAARNVTGIGPWTPVLTVDVP